MRLLKNHCTKEEYLAYDDASSEKHQFYNGEIFATSSISFNHSRISTDVIFQLQARLSKTPYEAMNSNIDIRITKSNGFNTNHPNVSVYLGDPKLTDNNYTLLNPSLIMGVLLLSTRNYDQGDYVSGFS